MKKRLFTGALLAVVIAGAPLSVSAATEVSIYKTGPRSVNEVLVGSRGQGSLRVRVRNNTNANVVVVTDQASQSGNARVMRNTDAGSAKTGSAENENATMGGVVVENDNSDVACCGQNGDVSVEIKETGSRSRNTVRVNRAGSGVSVKNNTNLDVVNDTVQTAVSGDATVRGNTEAGDATTGDAMNANETDLTVEVMNDNSGVSGCGCDSGDVSVSIDTTGPGSRNSVVIGGSYNSGTRITNNTSVGVENVTQQTALSGNATVSGNTTGGSATTGNASNTNTTSLNLHVHNVN